LKDKHNELEYEKNDGTKGKTKIVDVSKTHDLCILEPVEGIRPLTLAGYANTTADVWLIGHPGLRQLTLERGHLAAYTEIKLMDKCTRNQLLTRAKDLETEFLEALAKCKEQPLRCQKDIDRILQETMALLLGSYSNSLCLSFKLQICLLVRIYCLPFSSFT